MSIVEHILKDQQIQEQVPVSAPVAPAEAPWVRHKIWVNGLTADYGLVLKQALARDRKNIKATKHTKGVGYSIAVPTTCGFDTFLDILDQYEKGVINARYVTYNEKTGRAYIRDIIGETI